jgi:type IV pilus assembly protein PilV
MHSGLHHREHEMVTARISRREGGATMIEVLVTLVIIAFGLLGMAGLQARLQLSEVEAYQRSQALMLVSDMANRISVNRANAASYVTGTTYGTNMTCPTTTSTTLQRDLNEWCNALQGAGEKTGTTQQGAMIGGRGCIESNGGDYMITVAWQGMTALSAPPSSVTCGANQYDGASGAKCAGDLCRRVVTTIVRIGSLT